MKHLLLTLIGLLLFIPEVYAYPAPVVPPLYGEFAKELLKEIKVETEASVGGAAPPCDGIHQASLVAEGLRLMFLASNTLVASDEDIARSVCFTHDVQKMEEYLAVLMKNAITEANACRLSAASQYQLSAEKLWFKLYAIRRSGLDPTTFTPLPEVIPSPIPAVPDPTICSYDSAYAMRSWGKIGCNEAATTAAGVTIVPFTIFAREQSLLRTLYENIISPVPPPVPPPPSISSLASLPPTIPPKTSLVTRLRELVYALNVVIRRDANFFVNKWGFVRKLPMGTYTPFVFTPLVYPTAGESGCLGWPTATVTALGFVPVTGKNVPRLNTLPPVLTRELAETLAVLATIKRPENYTYGRDIAPTAKETSTPEFVFYGDEVQKNREDLSKEYFSLLSIRDPQKAMENMGNDLHAQSRLFASEVVILPGAPTVLPKFRQFAVDYATFLLKMCVNRGCEGNLMRAIELAYRDECFSQFILDDYFLHNPSASTLRTCRTWFTVP